MAYGGRITVAACFPWGKGVELVEVQHDDGQNGPQLDDHEEHVHECLADIELDEFIDENPDAIDEVIWALFDGRTLAAYEKALEE